MSSALAYDAACETFQDVERLLYATIHRFMKRYGTYVGTFDDLKSEAYVVFCLVNQDYESDQGPTFAQYLRWKLWRHLIELVRTKTRKNNQHPREAFDERMPAPSKGDGFCMESFLRSLSVDARIMVTVALTEPGDIRLAIAQRGRATPRNVRAAIREFLSDIGWTASQITNTFNEIRRAL